MSREQCGLWTRWSTTGGDLKEAPTVPPEGIPKVRPSRRPALLQPRSIRLHSRRRLLSPLARQAFLTRPSRCLRRLLAHRDCHRSARLTTLRPQRPWPPAFPPSSKRTSTAYRLVSAPNRLRPCIICKPGKRSTAFAAEGVLQTLLATRLLRLERPTATQISSGKHCLKM